MQQQGEGIEYADAKSSSDKIAGEARQVGFGDDSRRDLRVGEDAIKSRA